jgi:hypothetical protein
MRDANTLKEKSPGHITIVDDTKIVRSAESGEETSLLID